MNTMPLSPFPPEDGPMLSLARSVAMDLQELDDILKAHQLSYEQWAEIAANPRFQAFLKSSVEDWNKPLNTPERIRLKALAMVELGLEEMWRALHDVKEPLTARVELFKTVAKMGSVDVEKRVDVANGEAKFSVVINLGADNQLKISAPTLPAKVIDVDDH